MGKDPHAEGIKKSIEDIIGADTSLRRKKKTDEDFQKEKFTKLIQTLDEIEVRSIIMGGDLGLDFTKYDDKFYSVIDGLLGLLYPKEACELIFFYLYERINEDGSTNELVDEDGNIVPLVSPTDLWYLIKIIQDKIGKAKKKA
jgi:hypothetical protein